MEQDVSDLGFLADVQCPILPRLRRDMGISHRVLQSTRKPVVWYARSGRMYYFYKLEITLAVSLYPREGLTPGPSHTFP
jgi:hypothetical protein